MVTQHSSSALRAPASSKPYPMAKPGYGKRAAPGQPPCRTADFALLPERERYVAGFIDRLPDGAAMDVKSLAKQLPLYGQQAVGSALRIVAYAGHLRRVRCLVRVMGQFRWVFRTFWSRTARDDAWWAAAVRDLPGVIRTIIIGARDTRGGVIDAPYAGAVEAVEGRVTEERVTDSRVAGAPGGSAVEPSDRSAVEPADALAPAGAPAPAPAPAPARAEALEPAPAAQAPEPPSADSPVGHSQAYLALARLGRIDSRLTLSAADCAVLEGRAAEWLARGVNTDYLTQALTAGLPPQVGSPVGFVRRRLADKIPPHVSADPAPPPPGAPVHRALRECVKCAAPGRPEALPDGLCRPCRVAAQPGTAPEPPAGLPSERDVRAFAAELRVLLKSP
ncbi:MarR family transcriptional regulator [Streptomyces sp. NBC_00178]|uniref:MarR family transcriptional regulator n=1 Tax=Streptomyces sp. NBC_00178 TaxID=2975672 RepID=UPI002E29D2A9|nr:MarR family transcriptional regulator [Streptomyces sp. NBC_00178]